MTRQRYLPLDPNLIYYISGPMTGYENFNFPEFNKVANYLRENSYIVFNPAELALKEGQEWSYYMKADIKAMMYANAQIMLDGWELSKGSTTEAFLGVRLGMKFYKVWTWEEISTKHIMASTFFYEQTYGILKPKYLL